jgi:hypothetical protein
MRVHDGWYGGVGLNGVCVLVVGRNAKTGARSFGASSR